MDFVYHDDCVVEKLGAVAGQLLELLCGDAVVVDEADTATRVLVCVPDELGENLLANFRLFRRAENLIIRLGLVKIGHPYLGGRAQVALCESEDFNGEHAVDGIFLLEGRPVIAEAEVSEAAEGNLFEEVLAEREGRHHNDLFAGGGEEGL